MSTLSQDDLEMIEGVDYDNVLDMNVRLTDVYLNKIKNTHTKEHMKGAKRGDKDSMKYSYRQLDELKGVVKRFIPLWKQKNEAMKVLSHWTVSSQNLPSVVSDIVSTYQTTENKLLNEIHR